MVSPVVKGGRESGQAAWTERIELPIHMPSKALVTDCPGVVPAPSVSSRGTKWSAVGWANSAFGPLVR
jgi:hypothetical protein